MTESEFIKANRDRSISELALILSKNQALNSSYILAQINGIQKAKNKLTTFYNTSGIIYPSRLSIEQCSSEGTAIYKSNLVQGEKLIDLTGGFGIDSFYFSKMFKQVTYIESNTELFSIVKKNLNLLNTSNVDMINSTAEEFLKAAKKKADIVYIDPSRRSKGNRVFKLDKCTPNIINLIPSIFSITNKILLKTAPFLDIKQSLSELQSVSKVWVVSVNNDCKEVLYLLEKGFNSEPEINTINLSNITQKFKFSFAEEKNMNPPYSEPLKYLYEPNSSILNAGGFKSISKEFKIKKLASNTHLYTSNELIINFPGRTFTIKNILPYSSKEFKKLNITKANISCRNFKDKPEQVKKKLKLKDGGNSYLFATTNSKNKPILIICVK